MRQAERLLERNELPEKPFEPWELRLSLRAGSRLSQHVLSLDGAVGRRGDFELGPVDLDLVPGERLSIVGRNGAGKSTLLGMLLGEVPLVAGERSIGRSTVIGAIGQDRAAFAGDAALVDEFVARTGTPRVEARTLLAKFGLGAEHVTRACSDLSPGERTRAHLAELQARGVNLLVLDEPTNHLDLEAVEQLENALADYDGASWSSPTTGASSSVWRRRGRSSCRYSAAAAHGRSEAKDIEVEARQAPRAARDRRPARAGLPDLQAAEATSSRLPELQDVQGPGRRAAPHRRAVESHP